MTFIELFKKLIALPAQPDQALKIEQLAVLQGEQLLLKAGRPTDDAEAMELSISEARGNIWDSIERHLKLGETPELILKYLL